MSRQSCADEAALQLNVAVSRVDEGGARLTAADREAAVLAAIDPGSIAQDVSRLVRAPSPTGRELGALRELATIADGHGFIAEHQNHDLDALRSSPGYPGEEAARAELHGLTISMPGSGSMRLCLNGHLDVVAPGAHEWAYPPFDGRLLDGRVHGCGALDMKGGVIAALHAMSAVRRTIGCAEAEVVLQAVSSEEDGGLGTFAALEVDDRFDACLIPEPSAFDVVVAHGGALTFTGIVRGVSAHAAVRLQGVSAIDRYMAVHAALADHERTINADVSHPLMARLELPYPLLVGRVHSGQWSSQVPDELEFEGRVGVAVGGDLEAARAGLEAAVAAADDDRGPPTEIRWHGGQFAPAETPIDSPFVSLVHDAAREQCDPAASLCGVPYGADMRLFSERGIPCVMLGPPGLERAHAADEWVSVDDLTRISRAIALTILRFTRNMT